MNNLIANYFSNLSKFNKKIIIIFIDLFFFLISHLLANYLRIEKFYFSFDFYPFLILITCFLYFTIFYLFNIYNVFFRHTTLDTIKQIFYGCLVYLLIFSIFLYFISFNNFPRSIAIIQPIVFLIFIIINRYLIKYVYENFILNSKKINAIIYGAGDAGTQSINLLKNYNIVNFIDDDKKKQGRHYGNILIIDKSQLDSIIIKKNVKIIFIAFPSTPLLTQRKIINNLKKYKIEIQVLPDISLIISNKLTINDFQPLEVNELINRKILEYDLFDIHFFDNKNILITGGGGSIGSEIARQILSTQIKSLIVLDHSEFNLYNIKKEIDQFFDANPNKIQTFFLLGTITDLDFVKNVFSTYNIHIVFHAAAYKHVNIVENNVVSSIKNNLIGTYNLSNVADKYKIEKFVLVSTDKAVRPTNIMGASKRLSEICIHLISKRSKTIFSTVRFGNVIGSSGSIIPIFNQQIKNRKPVTVTSKDVERYFMTIPEAVGLVLQSCIHSSTSKTYILNMGKPIKIFDLAKKMIELSNLTIKDSKNPLGDIEIKIIGMKKGEKIFEELSLGKTVKYSKSDNIFIDNYDLSINDNLEEFINKFNKALTYNNVTESILLMKNYVEDFKTIEYTKIYEK